MSRPAGVTDRNEVLSRLNYTRVTWRAWALAIAGVVGAGFVLVTDLDPENPLVSRTLAVVVLVATLWITQVIPLAATSLIPLVAFPLLGIMDGGAVAGQYVNHIIFLFIGGFMIALAIERWDLHRRIALVILRLFGVAPTRLIAGFLCATAFLSMWINNTASTMMMVAIAAAVLRSLQGRWNDQQLVRFSPGLLLAVAYGSSIGGIATLVGTAPNLSFVRIFEIHFPNGPEITFGKWMLMAGPISVLLLIVAWFVLCRMFAPRGAISRGDDWLQVLAAELGRMSRAQWIVLLHFALLVVLWVTRSDLTIGQWTFHGWGNWLPYPQMINDGTVAIAIALPLFFIPSGVTPGERLLDWQTAVQLPWGIVLLLGGGFALASGFVVSGLSVWLGNQLAGLGALPTVVLLAGVCLGVTFVTELTSNTATAETLLPIAAALAVAVGMDPLALMIPLTICCSLAFMMPVATPPNAIVFGTMWINLRDMLRAGIVLNLLSVCVVVAVTWLLGPWIWSMTPDELPAWAELAGLAD